MRNKKEIWKRWRELEEDSEENEYVNYFQEILAIVNYARESCDEGEIEDLLRWILGDKTIKLKLNHNELRLTSAFGVDGEKIQKKFLKLLEDEHEKISEAIEKIAEMAESDEELIFMVFMFGVFYGAGEALFGGEERVLGGGVAY